MTIPIAPPNIQPQFVQQQQPQWLVLAMRAIEQRQQLDLERQKLKRDQEQFELTKKLTGTQIEGAQLINEQRRREFKERDADLVARDEALQLYTGNLPRITDAQSLGDVMAKVKDPRVAGHLLGLLAQSQNILNQQPNLQTLGTSEGFVQVPPQGGAATPLMSSRTGRQLQPSKDEGVRRIPVVTEREKASYAVGAIHANAIVNRIEMADPDIVTRVARKVATRKSILSGLVHRFTGSSPEERDLIVEQQIESSMTPQELEFYQASKQFLANVIPAIAGKQMTAREYAIQAPAFFSMGATNPRVAAARRKARASRIRGFITEAGDAFPERLPEVSDLDLSEYGFGVRTLPPRPGETITPAAPRYHPQFHVPRNRP